MTTPQPAALPELPEPRKAKEFGYNGDVFSADQMRAYALAALQSQAVPMNREPGDLPCGESSSDGIMSNCLGMGLHVCYDCAHGITAQGAQGGEG